MALAIGTAGPLGRNKRKSSHHPTSREVDSGRVLSVLPLLPEVLLLLRWFGTIHRRDHADQCHADGPSPQSSAAEIRSRRFLRGRLRGMPVFRTTPSNNGVSPLATS